MIRPPTWAAMFDSVTGAKGVREKLPQGTISNTQWRRAGVKYTSNECFVDIEESIDAIIDKNGHIVFSEIRGQINCKTKLSGMPDLNLSFVNPRALDDVRCVPPVPLLARAAWLPALSPFTSRVLSTASPSTATMLLGRSARAAATGVSSCRWPPVPRRARIVCSFHPCVRLNEWQNSRNLSFIPPDGNFVLSNYVIGPEQQISLPVNVRPSISFSDEGYGRLDIEVSTGSTGGKMIEDFAIIIPMPKSVNQASLTPTVGTYSFDQVTKTIKWEIKKLPNTSTSSLTGSVSSERQL